MADNSHLDALIASDRADKMLNQLPADVKQWAEGLPWNERRYVLSLCHLLCAAPPDVQAEFLDNYTADGLIAKILTDIDSQRTIEKYLHHFHIKTELKGRILRQYIRQFYLHSTQDAGSTVNNRYLESALKLVVNPQDQANILNYILGFEVLRMFFLMSWQQHERLYQLQVNQEGFFQKYIKPIQTAHRHQGIINPKNEKVFFAQRDYFVITPKIPEKVLIGLIMETFSLEKVIGLGFGITRNLNYLVFDYHHIFAEEEPTPIF